MIQTVKGEISAQDIRHVLIHEHIQCVSTDMLRAFGSAWLSRENLIEYAVKVLRELKRLWGIDLFVDGTPIDSGRDIHILQEVSEKSGVSISASTGLYWFPSCLSGGRTAEELAGWISKECMEGAEQTDAKPGILKCATDGLGLTPDNKKRLRAVGIASARTGLPVYVHSNHREEIAEGQIEILCGAGADPEKLLLGHCAQRPDADYLERLLEKGVSIVMDQCHCVRYSTEEIAKTLVILCGRGWGNKILLSHDLCVHNDFAGQNDTGLQKPIAKQIEMFSFLFQKLHPAFLKAGGKETDWEAMTGRNAIKLLDR